MNADQTADELPLRPALLQRLLAPLRRPGLNPPPWARAALARLERPDAVVPLLAALAARRPRTADADPTLPPLVLAPWSPPSLAVELATRATPQSALVVHATRSEPAPAVPSTQPFRAQPPVVATRIPAAAPASPRPVPSPPSTPIATASAVEAASNPTNTGPGSPAGPSRPRRLLYRPSQPLLAPPPAAVSAPFTPVQRDTPSPASSPPVPPAAPAAAEPPAVAVTMRPPPASLELGPSPVVARAPAVAPSALPHPSETPSTARVKAHPPVAPAGAERLPPSHVPRVVAPAPVRPEPPTPHLPAALPSRPAPHGSPAATGVPASAAAPARTTVAVRPPAPSSTPPSEMTTPPRVLLDDAQINALTERVQRALQRRAQLERGRR